MTKNSSLAAGLVHPVTVTAAAQAGSSSGRLTELCVEVSFNDGVSWTRIPVFGGTAFIPHPAGSGFVSLRAKVSDDAGNSHEQTIIHAYRFGS